MLCLLGANPYPRMVRIAQLFLVVCSMAMTMYAVFSLTEVTISCRYCFTTAVAQYFFRNSKTLVRANKGPRAIYNSNDYRVRMENGDYAQFGNLHQSNISIK